MDDTQPVTSMEARKRLLVAYSAGRRGDFTDFAIRPLLNPIEQRDARNKRTIHPLAVMGPVLLLLAVIAAYFLRH